MSNEQQKHDKLHERQMEAAVETARLLTVASSGVDRAGVILEGLSIKIPKGYAGETMVVLKGRTVEGDPVVGFHSGEMTDLVLCKALMKWSVGDVKWRDDEWRT